MPLLLRALILATVLALDVQQAAQPLTTLHIKVVLVDTDGRATPVPRHALLISDNPASASPRRIFTGADGTARVQLRPGNYTVESDQPVAFLGKAYQWIQVIDVFLGREASLELTAANAEVEAAASPSTGSSAGSIEASPSSLLIQWQDSVVAIWTPTMRLSGFLVDRKGLIATSQRGLAGASAVEVQLSPTVKVPATVLATDPVRDVAVLRIDPEVMAAVRPVPLPCDQPQKPVLEGQEIVALGAPLRRLKGATSAIVSRVDSHTIVSDLTLDPGGAGGPVFAGAGEAIGISSPGSDDDGRWRGSARVVRIADACGVVATAGTKMDSVPAPPATRLPVEPQHAFPPAALKDAAQRRAGSLNPYPMSTTDFDILFMTPVQIFGAQFQTEQVARRERTGGTRASAPEPAFVRPFMDFANWSGYMADNPPVLVVRVTPRLVEGFWTKVARGAAQTQGVSIPPIKRFTSGFLRMRVTCGDVDVTPIHPFRVEQRISDTDAIREGLYIFDPAALGPSCGTVKLVLYSEKEPEKADTRIVDPKLIQQIWDDFAPFRAAQ